MRISWRMILVLAATAGLLAVFLWNADLGRVVADLGEADGELLLLALATIVVNVVVRSLRWQYLLAPLGPTRFGYAVEATIIGFAASAVLPARAGEIIRPFVLARREQLSTAGAFATIVIERLLDLLMVLVLFAASVFVFQPRSAHFDPRLWRAIEVGGITAGVAALALLGLFAFLAGDTRRIWRLVGSLERWLPARAARGAQHLAETFASGLASIRQPRRLIAACLWSLPLWLSVAVGTWAVTRALGIAMPFAGTFPLLVILIVGVAVPTPGAIGGLDEAYRLGVVTLFGASPDRAIAAAIVLHAITFVPVTLTGLVLAAREGLNLTRTARLARESAPGGRAA
jgi:uncharacterized protein (TIRG00374 family)